MALIKDYVPLILAQAPLAPYPVVVHHIKSAIDEYFTKTCTWTTTLSNVSFVAGDPTYRLVSLNGTKVARVLKVVSKDYPLRWTFAHGVLTLIPTPSINGSMDIDIALTIDSNTPTIPDWLDEDAVVSGTLSRILMIMNQTWSNPELGAYHQKEFTKYIAKERIAKDHEYTTNDVEVFAPPFGG